ncbi:hypothetical protein [Corallococcus sp. CA047B]|uniref:hypothetical protein n=1 Tax=Corallococcus sp. CA047B TaxID=2316729 RepID=UPI00131511F0|nr:hypothetical protein [Corallococcus sp. CA047B]
MAVALCLGITGAVLFARSRPSPRDAACTGAGTFAAGACTVTGACCAAATGCAGADALLSAEENSGTLLVARRAARASLSGGNSFAKCSASSSCVGSFPIASTSGSRNASVDG